MIYAHKGNKVVQINEGDMNNYKKDGFDILDNEGNVIEYSDQKTVKYVEYMKVVEENNQLKEEIKKLKKGKKATKK